MPNEILVTINCAPIVDNYAQVLESKMRRILKATEARVPQALSLCLVEPTDPRERMLMLYREWVKCRPHQVHLKACVERAMVRCRTRIEMAAWR